VSVSNPSYTAAYTYSADGLRLRAQESNHPYPDRWFLYAGVLPFCEGTLSGDTHSLCAQGRLYTSNKIYIREGLSYYDPLVFLTLPGVGYRYYLYDGLGSTRQLLSSAQTTTDTYSYEAFGNLLGSTGSTSNPYRYVGSLGYYQTGSSLMHLGARYYMPEIGRFIQRDPIHSRDNWYAYVLNNPTNLEDPAGLVDTECPECLAAYNKCVSKATARFDKCAARILGPGALIGQDVIACLAGCAVVSIWNGELTWGPCAGACVIGASVWTVVSLVRAYFQCARPYQAEIKKCGEALKYCPHETR